MEDSDFFFRPEWLEAELPVDKPARFHFRNLVHGWVDMSNPNAIAAEPPGQVYYDEVLNQLFIVNILPIAKLAIINTDGNRFEDRYVFCIDEFETIKTLWKFVGDM